MEQLEISKELRNITLSNAFLSLTNASRVTLILLLTQRGEGSQREVKFPYSDAEKYMNRITFRNSIRQLKSSGFIEVTAIGGLHRKTNVYKLLSKWRDAGFMNDVRKATWTDRYHAYLLSPEWRAKATKKVKQARSKCQLCNSGEGISVHHRTYDHIFKEPLIDLIVLCKGCHEKHHGI